MSGGENTSVEHPAASRTMQLALAAVARSCDLRQRVLARCTGPCARARLLERAVLFAGAGLCMWQGTRELSRAQGVLHMKSHWMRP